MSGQYSFHLYTRRPIRVLLDAIGCEPLLLPETYPVGAAAQAALGRSVELAYEPIIVEPVAEAPRPGHNWNPVVGAEAVNLLRTVAPEPSRTLLGHHIEPAPRRTSHHGITSGGRGSRPT